MSFLHAPYPRKRKFESALNGVTYENGRPITVHEFLGRPDPSQFKPDHDLPWVPKDV